MKVHVARTVSHCFHQLRLLKGCIKSLPFEAARVAVAAFVTSQVDRYNSLLVGAPKYLLDCLQSVLNADARLLCNRRKYDHVTPLLRDVLHWLPVPLSSRVQDLLAGLQVASWGSAWVSARLL